MKKFVAVIGMVAPFVCIAALIVGAQLRPGYSSITHTVSLLAAPDTPNVEIVNVLFFVYNIFLIAFGIGCMIIVRMYPIRVIAPGFFITITGVFGIAASMFPQDPMHMPMSASGITHKVFAICMTLSALFAVMAQARFDEVLGRSRRSRFSLASLVFLSVMGVIATYTIETDWFAGGLIERITLSGFLLWLFVEGLFIFYSRS